MGLGLGVAAMAQMRNTEGTAVQQNVMMNVQNSTPIQQQRYEVISHPQTNLLSGGQTSILDTHPSAIEQARKI